MSHNPGSPSYSFLEQWFMVGAIIPIYFTFFYLFIFTYSFIYFDEQNDLCSLGTLIFRFDFSKDLGSLESQLRNKNFPFFFLSFFKQAHSLP